MMPKIFSIYKDKSMWYSDVICQMTTILFPLASIHRAAVPPYILGRIYFDNTRVESTAQRSYYLDAKQGKYWRHVIYIYIYIYVCVCQ